MSNPRILIVDDVPTNIQLVASILSTEAYDLSFANSGKDALLQISETAFDLILLDIMMPELDGLTVAARLKKNPRTARIPIIFLTAKTDEESIVQGFEVGAADYLTKPFNPSELKSRVKTHVALKMHEDVLQRRNEELAEAIDIKNKILSVASHDLKNPLSSILGFSQLMSQYPAVQKDPDMSEMIDFISKAAERMESLITELLDTAALEMGRMILNKKNCNPQQLLSKIIAEKQSTAQKKQQTLIFNPGEDRSCQADPSRLKQVFENLISNALKYSPRGARIEVRSGIQGNYWCVEVADQGPGFSESDLSRLYGYFQRLSARPTGGESSTGVGLAVVKQIVDLHQGSIRLSRNTPQGSTFEFCLPC